MDPASLFSRETMSVAMTHVPKSVPILGGIYKLATDIQETTQRVAVNQKQSEQLSERIDTLVGFLAQRDFSEQLSEAMHIALHRFESFLRQCLEFIETFVETSWFKRVIGNKEHERKFVDLNRELTQYSNDLNFGIGLSNMPKQKKLDGNEEVQPEPEEKEDDRRRSPSQTNSHQRRENIFISGLWQYQYNQYNQWFGPFQHQIAFNPMTKTLQGYGEDNVGQYALGGSFSVSKGRIELIQQYQVNMSVALGRFDLCFAFSPGPVTQI